MPVIEHLVANTFGTHIGKYSGRLKITQKGETLQQAPLIHLQSVHVLSRGISVSSDALEACCERGIPIFYVDARGMPYASVHSAGLTGTVLTRREQLRAYDDARGFELAKAIAIGKVQNQAATLRYLTRNRKETPLGDALLCHTRDVLDFRAPLDDLSPQHVDDVRAHIMAIEANAAKVYWEAARQVVPEHYGWTTRTGRGATDPINSLLNYGYGILYGQIEKALLLAGLDPYAGFIHADRSGKPSLVLDFVEEFRQVAVDRVVFGLVTRNFDVAQDDKGRMCDDTRQDFATHILNRLDAKVRHDNDRQPLRVIIQSQARKMVRFLRGDSTAYSAFQAEA